MDEKQNIQDLSDMLSQHHGLAKDAADDFVREFFDLIKSSLEKDKYVKIKGLGVFKLISVEPRESINIQTKERFEIPGYTKVSFIPDNSLKEAVNKPFSHFETVPLNEHVVFEKTIEKDTEEAGIAPQTPQKKPPRQSRNKTVSAIIGAAILLLSLLGWLLLRNNHAKSAPPIPVLPPDTSYTDSVPSPVHFPSSNDSISLQSSHTNIFIL